ncbi:hypothetical protein FG05_35041 [Fusarium graminearum]|nr:hypothetical protein FG05_35041 [Fusarium graminearum]
MFRSVVHVEIGYASIGKEWISIAVPVKRSNSNDL